MVPKSPGILSPTQRSVHIKVQKATGRGGEVEKKRQLFMVYLLLIFYCALASAGLGSVCLGCAGQSCLPRTVSAAVRVHCISLSAYTFLFARAWVFLN